MAQFQCVNHSVYITLPISKPRFEQLLHSPIRTAVTKLGKHTNNQALSRTSVEDAMFEMCGPSSSIKEEKHRPQRSRLPFPLQPAMGILENAMAKAIEVWPLEVQLGVLELRHRTPNGRNG